MTTDLQRNIVTIEPESDVALDLAAIPTAIVDAGFRAGRMWVRATGRPTPAGDAFLIDGWSAPLPLAGALEKPKGPIAFEVVRESGRLALRPGEPPVTR